jgi:TRAP-type C4-dicarboxylate transport system permease small subunit
VSEPTDGDGGGDGDKPKPDDAVPEPAKDIPKTRRHESVADPAAEPEPLPRASVVSMEQPHGFPDDGALAAQIRRVDNALGLAEQVALFGILVAVVCVAALAALSDKLFDTQIGRWWHYIVRGGTFAVAMFGAVYATHQQRHLAMDLVSRRLSPRGRLVLGLVLKLFTIAIAAVLFHTGMHLRETASGIDKEHLDLGFMAITDKDIVATVPIGAALIILHSILHAVIDVEYLARNKLPPERARSGH